MIKGINNFSTNYFSPLIEGKKDNKPLKGLKIASYFTVVIPLVVALLWGGSALAGRVKQILAKENSTTKKTDDVSREILSTGNKDKTNKLNKEELESFLYDTISTMKAILEHRSIEKNSEVLFDTDVVPKNSLEFMKEKTLGEIEFKEIENPEKFKMVYKNKPVKFIEFSNRTASNGETRANVLRDKLELKRKKEGGEDKTVYDAITELFSPGIDNDIYTGFKGMCSQLYTGIDEKHLDAFSTRVLDLLAKDEVVDNDRAKKILEDVYS